LFRHRLRRWWLCGGPVGCRGWGWLDLGRGLQFGRGLRWRWRDCRWLDGCNWGWRWLRLGCRLRFGRGLCWR
jgi:hypothetical protein